MAHRNPSSQRTDELKEKPRLALLPECQAVHTTYGWCPIYECKTARSRPLGMLNYLTSTRAAVLPENMGVCKSELD